jgi:hypothetical protein
MAKRTKRWMLAKIADERAIELHLQLQAVAEMLPLIEIQFPEGRRLILVADKNRRFAFSEITIDTFLSLNVQQAKDNGGTYEAFMASRRSAKRVTQHEVDEEVTRFLSGEEDR